MKKTQEFVDRTGGGPRARRLAIWMWALLFTLVGPAFQRVTAQQLGGINGTVTDSTGAVIPNAKITVHSPEAGYTYTSETSSAGTFLMVNVIPGSYTVTIESPGFAKYVKNDFRVDIGATSAVLATLTPGAAAATVEVSADAAAVLTASPEIGTTIEPQIWNDMPVEVAGGMRDARSVAMSNIPGVEYEHYGYGAISGAPIGAEFNYFNGLPQNSNATMVPPYDFVNEVHVDTTSMDAQDGWAVGAINFQTKFGNNQLHGSAFEINRNNFFDSRPALIPTVTQDHENNYGFSVGGPVWLPKVYNGHNKTFFYFSWEGFRQNNQATGGLPYGYATVPTAAMKQGDFSGLMTNGQNGVVQAPIFDPTTSSTNPTQFSSGGVLNVIPTAQLSATALALAKYIPDPNVQGTGPGGLQNNYYYNVPIPSQSHRWAFSLDEHISENKEVNVAVVQSPSPQVMFNNGAPIFGGPGSSNPLSGVMQTLWPSGFIFGNYMWAIHPSLIFTAGVSVPFDYSWSRLGQEPSLGIAAQNFTGSPIQSATPTITFNGIDQPQSLGRGQGMWGWDYKKPYYAFHSNLNWTKGKHIVDFGAQGMYYMYYGFNCGNCAGQFNFLGATTDNYSSAGTLNQYGGSPFASFMIGQADSAGLSYSPEAPIKYASYGMYVQDAYKFSPKLTVNYGLRWDIQIPLWVTNGLEDFVSPTSLQVANTAAGGQLGVLSRFGTCATCAGYNRAAIHWGQLGPRLGFSYAVDQNTVIGGGFSMIWQQTPSNQNSNGFSNDGNAFGTSNNIPGNGTNQPGFGNWDTNTLNFPAAAQFANTALVTQTVGYFDPQVAGRDPYYTMWNLGVQRKLPHNWFLHSSYVGQRGIHLVRFPANLNLLPEGTPQQYGNVLSQGILSQKALNLGLSAPFSNFSQLWGNAATIARALLPYPQYGAIMNNFNTSGMSSYNAWQNELDKRYSGGLALLSTFTMQRTITNAGDLEGWESNGQVLPVDPYNPSTAIAPTGPRWMASIAGTYDLPVGPGKKWMNNSHLTGELIGGWKLSWGLYYGDGSPHGISAFGSPFGFGNSASRIATTPIKVNGNYLNTYKKWVESGAPSGAYPVIIQNNGAFEDPAVAAGFSTSSPQWQYIPGNSKAGYSEFRDPTYKNEQVGMMKEFGIMERAKGILRVDYFNPLNRWYVPWAVDTNIDDPTFGKITNPRVVGSPRQGQMTFRIEF